MPRTDPLFDSLRPHGGWLRSVRQNLGLSLQAVADRLDVSPQAVHQFEKSEAAGTISLRQLGHVAAAMGGRVTYAVIGPDANAAAPTPTKTDPSPAPPPSPAAAHGVEHSMFLENQASGRFD